MHFRGVDKATLENGRALNAAFLALATGPAAPAGLDPDFIERLATLRTGDLERLSRVPFLLFTVAVVDAAPGISAALREPRDLFDDRMARAEVRLVTATLALLWSLARSDRHAARFLAGTSRRWCDDIAEASLMDVLDTTRRFETLVVPRTAARRTFWDKLLLSASDHRSFVRRAARQSALQCVLTELCDDPYAPVAVAACRKRTPPKRVAE